MPSVSNVFLAGVLLGTGASLGGGAFLAPPDDRAVAESDAPPLEGMTSAGAAKEAGETLAGMGALAPRARAGRGPYAGRFSVPLRRSSNIDAGWLAQDVVLDDEWDGEVVETEQSCETDGVCGVRLSRFERLLAPGADGEDPASRKGREASLWYAIAMVRALTGDVAATMAALEKATALQPNPDQIVHVLGQLGPEEMAPRISLLVEKVPGTLLRVRPLIVALLSAEPPKTAEAFALEAQALDRPRDGRDDRLAATGLLIETDAERTDAILAPRADTFDRRELALLARRFLDEGQRVISAAWWKRLCARPPTPDDGELNLGRLRREFDPSAEIEDLREQLRKEPDDGDLWAKLAAQLTQAGDRRGAFEALLEALRIEPNDLSIVAKLLDLDAAASLPLLERLSRRPMTPALLKVLGVGFAKNGLVEKAGDAFFQAQERNPADYELLKLIVSLDPERALLRLTEMTSKPTWQNDDEILGARANALLATGDGLSAYQLYARALEIDPQDADWLAGLADADPARAIPLLEAQRAKAPEDENLAGALAAAYAAAGRVAEATVLFEEAIGMEEPGTRWPVRYAKIAPERALAVAVAAAGRDSKSADAWIALGDVYCQLGRIPEARAAYEQGQEKERAGSEIAVRLAKLR